LKTTVASVAELEKIAADLAVSLRPGDVVGLRGGLGSGKTTFVRAIVRTLHGADEAASPTFIFRHHYAGSPPIEHLDLYRIDSPSDAVELGLHEAFSEDAVVLVEWPERLPGLLPAHAIRVTIEGAGDAPRSLAIEYPA
jgi:tRNA threonylcarbamoyl adenosine modification protein YjeE